MVTRRKYNKPPVQEIVCDFHFHRGTIDLKTIMALAECPTFKAYTEQTEVIALPIEKPLNEKNEILRFKAPRRTVQFKKDKGESLIQVSNGLLAFNQVGPYDGWETLKPTLLNILDAYITVVQPQEMHRITLRYLDKIDIAEKNADFADYVLIVPSLPNEFSPTSFFCSTYELPFDNDILRIELKQLQPESPQQLSLLMDFHYFIQCKNPSREEIAASLERAHEVIWTHFEYSITPKARDLFEEVSPNK